MKKILISMAIVSFCFVGCNNNEDGFNDNHQAPYNVSAESLLLNAQKELIDQVTTPEVNLSPFRFFAQYWAQTTYNDESRYRLTSRLVSDNHWNNLYRDVLGNLESAKDVIATEVKPLAMAQSDWDTQQKNKLAVIEIIEVYTFQIIVDTYGDVPYSEALNVDIKLPKYDDDAAIYPDLIARLDAAIANLDDSGASFATGDNVFHGDVAHWRMFANTEKLKLGINLADVNPTLAQSTIESAYAGGVIETNANNAVFDYPAAAPNYNPIYAQTVAANRTDFVPSETIVNKMNSLSDARRAVYFTEKNGTYIGGINGATNTPFSAFSQIGDRLKAAGAPGLLFEASEVNFYLAEAAARGYAVGGTEDVYYTRGIQASFDYWGVDATAYLANPDVAYATATGTWQEKIGTQEWLALYNRPFEGWTEYRRLDFPVLTAPANATPLADGVVPRRMSYPINERTVNTDSYNNAVTAIGGQDRMAVRVFWDIN